MVDKTDIRILEVLLSNARLSYREIGSRVGVSAATAMTRVKNLEQRGVILRYSAILDHERLGYELTAITEVTVSKGKLLEMEREIAKLPCVCAVYDTTGLTDAILIAKFKNRQDLSNFTKSLLAMPFVERTNTHLVLTTVKEDFKLV
jgi:DNA-binding Lrp family transcriptional regulator